MSFKPILINQLIKKVKNKTDRSSIDSDESSDSALLGLVLLPRFCLLSFVASSLPALSSSNSMSALTNSSASSSFSAASLRLRPEVVFFETEASFSSESVFFFLAERLVSEGVDEELLLFEVMMAVVVGLLLNEAISNLTVCFRTRLPSVSGSGEVVESGVSWMSAGSTSSLADFLDDGLFSVSMNWTLRLLDEKEEKELAGKKTHNRTQGMNRNEIEEIWMNRNQSTYLFPVTTTSLSAVSKAVCALVLRTIVASDDDAVAHLCVCGGVCDFVDSWSKEWGDEWKCEMEVQRWRNRVGCESVGEQREEKIWMTIKGAEERELV